MFYRLILLALLFPLLAQAQTTFIPDPFFEQALIDLGYDTGTPDGEVATANIASITYLNFFAGNINPGDITDLTGIEDFAALEELHCSFNDIQTIDLSGNSNLSYLDCSFNFVSELNVSGNPLLSNLRCYGNNLYELDVTNNLLLDTLFCGSNNLSEIDLSNNPELLRVWISSQGGTIDFNELDLSNNLQLEFLHCGALQLTSLDLSAHASLTSLTCSSNDLQSLNVKNGFNENFTSFSTGNNPNLTCITVDDALWSEENWTTYTGDISEGMFFSEDCALSVGEENTLLSLKVYPNPTLDRVTVELPKVMGGDLEILDLTGKVIMSQSLVGRQMAIDLQNFASGVYMIRVWDRNRAVVATQLLEKW